MKTKPEPRPAATNAPRPRRHQILIVEDHPVFRDGLSQLVSQEPDLAVCGQTSRAHEALQMTGTTNPDLVLVDLTLPGKGGLELIKDLRALHPKVPVLVISMHEESLYAERALRAGARGYIMKDEPPENMLRAVRQTIGGQLYTSAKVASSILDNFSGSRPKSVHSPISCLSDREFEVLSLLGEGKDSRAIAQQLHLSFKTVNAHRARIKEKLNLRNATELICYAARWVETQHRNAKN